MALGSSGRRQEPLHVIIMALALILAAFAGAAFGLILHSAQDAAEPERSATDANAGQDGETGPDEAETGASE